MNPPRLDHRRLPLVSEDEQRAAMHEHGDPLAYLWQALQAKGHPDPRGRAVTRANRILARSGMAIRVRRGQLSWQANRLRRYGLTLHLPPGYGVPWADVDVLNPWPFFAFASPYTDVDVFVDMRGVLGRHRSDRTGFGYHDPDGLLEFVAPVQGSRGEESVTAFLRHRSVEHRLRSIETRLAEMEEFNRTSREGSAAARAILAGEEAA